jgi:hypothetical protein
MLAEHTVYLLRRFGYLARKIQTLIDSLPGRAPGLLAGIPRYALRHLAAKTRDPAPSYALHRILKYSVDA